jgi:hypothetical protein
MFVEPSQFNLAGNDNDGDNSFRFWQGDDLSNFGTLNWSILLVYVIGNLYLGYVHGKKIDSAEFSESEQQDLLADTARRFYRISVWSFPARWPRCCRRSCDRYDR